MPIPTIVDSPVERLAHIQAEVARRVHLGDPVQWAEDRLGDTWWSAQKRIAQSVCANRRTAVKSCHEVGKSYIAAGLAGWWLDVHKTGDAFVVTSAPSGQQVRAILWREIGRVHTRGNLRGRVNQAAWWMPRGDKEELVAFGRKPDDYDPTAFQGIHAPRVLVIFDEACGMTPMLWEAGDTLIANDWSKILAIGNPDDPNTEFAEICKPGSGWEVIEISAFETPNFTGEHMPERVLQQLIGKIYVEEKRKRWAPTWVWTDDGMKVVPPDGGKIEETNPYWQSKILGRFPENTEEGGLIPISWIRAAQQRTIVPDDLDSNELGVDVGAGGDSSVIGHRRGGHFRILREDRNPDTMQTCGNVVHAIHERRARKAKVDSIGIGKGICDRGAELEEDKTVKKGTFVPISVGKKAKDDDQFVNLRAELYWHLRSLFESGSVDLDPEDVDTAAELVEIRYKRLSSGKIQIESKDQMKARRVPSPNRAESMMLCFAPEHKKREDSAVW